MYIHFMLMFNTVIGMDKNEYYHNYTNGQTMIMNIIFKDSIHNSSAICSLHDYFYFGRDVHHVVYEMH